MKICTSLRHLSQESLREVRKISDYIEFRFDLIGIDRLSIKSWMFQSPSIATYRMNEHIEESERIKFLVKCLRKGASMVDIEIETKPKHVLKLKKTCLTLEKQLIISYHNHELTPSLQELHKKVEKAIELGADIVKIATKAIYLEDLETLTRLQQLYGSRLVAFGMGNVGKPTRISSLQWGAPFCYTAADHHSKTAPGQFTTRKMRKIILSLGH